ncbi:Disease resistance RPP13-like protein 4, partial [Mucuna pruriens]
MSIGTNPMKAVSLLLKRLMIVEQRVDLNDLKSALININDLFSAVKKNEEELLHTLIILDVLLRDSNTEKLMKEKEEICMRIRISTQKLLPMGATKSNGEVAESSSKAFQHLKLNEREVDRSVFWSQLQDLEMLRADYNSLFDPLRRQCFHSLSLFPKNAVIKKRSTIFWWVGVGFIKKEQKETVEEEGEVVFDDLLKGNLILPHGNGNGNGNCPVVSKFRINPSIHHDLLSPLLKIENQFCEIYSQMITSSHHNVAKHACLALDQKKVKLSGELGFKSNHWRAVFNVGASYLNLGSRWLSKMVNLEVLHLGRWQDSALHHIEVESEEFLKELKGQKSLKYLSLRGISRIYNLPPTIVRLESLEILDLKTCHNLETLPNDIAPLKNLRHLDLSRCYLLERMSKGIEKLTKLQVLKGFLIGNPRMTPCRITDLANLKQLEKLSIHIGSEAVILDKEFESMKELSSLKLLKISWGVSGTKYSDIHIIFPSTLTKLHLEGFPIQNIPEWLKPTNLHEGLKELNIVGGKIQSMEHGESNNHWCMNIVRLKYLEHLNVDQTNLKEWFPLLSKMSIRTNPMKAIPVLLKRLRRTRTTMPPDESFGVKLENLISQLDNIKDLFDTVKRNKEELLDTLTFIDGHLRKLDKDKFDADMEKICQRIKDSTEKLLPKGASQGESDTEEFDLSKVTKGEKGKKVHLDPSSSQYNKELHDQYLNQKSIQVSYKDLKDDLAKICLLSLVVFPEHAVIKKRHTIYWWIGEGFVTNIGEKTAEEVGEDVFEKLLKCDLIVPHGNGMFPIVKKFKIHPHIHHELVSLVSKENQHLLGFSFQIPSHPKEHASLLVLEQQKVTLGDTDNLKLEDWSTVFNIGVCYLNFASQWLAKRKNLVVLQLGRWQDSPLHHIEVGNEEFLKELRDQKHLKYLSLRGISRIPELPPSIAQLESLEILDLKACHNLEALPSDIASMKSLTHLDVSQCYLLDSMPKGIEKLTQLQVLKGFVIGTSSKTPCRISDLANLKKLKRLSIHIGSEAVIQDREFESLKELTAVKCLKISWGVSGTKYSDIQVILPPNLEKLDLEGFPGIAIPEWLKPSRVPGGMKKLYIEGGKLKSLDHGEICHKWHVEIVRLKYLQYLQIEDRKLHKLFPSLMYVERTMVLNRSYPEWSIEE